MHSEIAVLMCRMNDVIRLTVTAYAYGQLRLAVTGLRLTVTYGLRTTTFHLERGELKESIVK